jgi:O-antigen ligase
MLRYINFFSFLFLLHWSLLWGSINTNHSEFFGFGRNVIQSVNSLRIILPLLFSILISIYFIYIFFTKKIKIKKIHLYFCAIGISQLIGLYLNNERIFLYFDNENGFDMTNINLIIFPFAVIFLFILCEYHSLKYLYKFFFAFVFFFLILIFNFSFWPKFYNFSDLYFLYEIFNPHDKNIFEEPSIRITGLSRILAIINLFIILYFLNLKKTYFKMFLQFFIIICTTLLFFMQSRGTLLCYFVSLVFIIFIIWNDKANQKTKGILLFIMTPLFLFFLINNHLQKNIKLKDISESNIRALTINTSGRVQIWSFTLKNYEYKKIFGYGPNGDRFFLKDFDKKKEFGDNASNNLIYCFISGGIVSLFFLTLVFFNFLLILKKFIKKKTENLNKSLFIENLSIVCLIYFSTRSIFENSFGIFSVDFLITYLSFSYLSSMKEYEQFS